MEAAEHVPGGGDVVHEQRDLLKTAVADDAAAAAPALVEEIDEPAADRCVSCGDEVGLLGFECRCGAGTFCSLHRFAEKHACDLLDSNKAGREQFSEKSTLVVAPKIVTTPEIDEI